jgi:hypothetical protein
MIISNLNIEIQNSRIQFERNNSQWEKAFNDLNSKLEETIQYYVRVINTQQEETEKILLIKEQEQSRLQTELERLKEHLIRMSDSFNNEAIIAEERENQLKLALSNAEKITHQQDVHFRFDFFQTFKLRLKLYDKRCLFLFFYREDYKLKYEQIEHSYSQVLEENNTLKETLKEKDEKLVLIENGKKFFLLAR